MDYKEMGKKIKECRIKMGYTQERLLDEINVSSVYISHMETGSTIPSLDTLINICNALSITPDFVLYDSLYESKEYIKDEIASLLKDCDASSLRLITKLIKSVLEEQETNKK